MQIHANKYESKYSRFALTRKPHKKCGNPQPGVRMTSSLTAVSLVVGAGGGGGELGAFRACREGAADGVGVDGAQRARLVGVLGVARLALWKSQK